jgi:hypothetical protein
MSMKSYFGVTVVRRFRQPVPYLHVLIIKGNNALHVGTPNAIKNESKQVGTFYNLKT